MAETREGRDREPLARLTPYELVFGAEVFEETLFPGIRDEMGERGTDAADPAQFVFLTSVGKLLRAIAGHAEPPGGGGEGGEAAGEGAAGRAGETAIREHGYLLFHAFNFWMQGRHVFFLEPEALAAVLDETVGAGAGGLKAPQAAGYLQLPQHRVWARVAEVGQPEPLDGVFWVMSAAGEGSPTRLDLLLVLGMRADRAGFSVVPVGAALEEDDRPGDWVRDARPGGDDFANTLPGGELDDLVSIETPAEALKLMALWFRYLERHPESLGAAERNPPDAAPSSSYALPPSALAYRRVRSVAADPPGRGRG